MEYKEWCPLELFNAHLVHGQCQSPRPVSFQNLGKAVEGETSKKEEEAWHFVVEFWTLSAPRLKWNLGRGIQGASAKTAYQRLKPRAPPAPLAECLTTLPRSI